jgi:hypothetical protein
MHILLRRRALRAFARVALLALALSVATPAARADTIVEPDGAQNVLSYFSCSAGLAIASTPFGAIIAFLNCVRILLHEMPLE